MSSGFKSLGLGEAERKGTGTARKPAIGTTQKGILFVDDCGKPGHA
jgi:hypothetical protein